MGELSGRRIALVGGAGFIGHHLAVKLKELGAEPFVIDSLTVNNYYYFREKADLIPNGGLYLSIIQQRLDILKENGIPLTEIDARDYIKLSEIIGKLDVDTIIQLAAVAHADRSNKDPYSTFDHSLRTLENALDIARSKHMNVKHFVYFSSSMVYGNFNADSVTEETPCEPLGIYGALKYAGEKIVIAYNQVFDLPYTIIRPSALYGARCVSRRVGQVFIENALQELEISIQGGGASRIDFTYIDDLVTGIVNVLENEKSKNQVFNMTYGDSRSINQMADIITEHFPDAKIKYLPKDKLTPERGTLCVDKAKQMIGYNPQFPLERGFVEYIKWYKSMWNSISTESPKVAGNTSASGG